MTHDLTPSRVVGADASLLSAPRLDNQASCYAGSGGVAGRRTARLRARVGALRPRGGRIVLRSRRRSPTCLATVLERIVLASGGNREDFLRRLPASLLASADMAHATHPNYPERHEPGHLIDVNAGPVLKVHPNLRYATDGRTAAAFALACRQAGVGAAALRAPRRPTVRVDDRSAGVGPDRHPDRRRRRPAACDALRARIDGCPRRRRVFGCAASVSCPGVTAGRSDIEPAVSAWKYLDPRPGRRLGAVTADSTYFSRTTALPGQEEPSDAASGRRQAHRPRLFA